MSNDNNYKSILIENLYKQSNGNFLQEGEGNNKYDDDVKKLFPFLWNSIKGNIETILPLASPKIRDEENIQSQRIKNIQLDMRLNSSTTRNMFTYPAIGNAGEATLVNIIPRFGTIYFLINGYSFLADKSALLTKAENKKGIVVFPSEIKKLKCLLKLNHH